MTENAPVSADTVSRARRIAFRVVVVLATLFTLFVLLMAFPLAFTNWLPVDLWLAVRTDPSHPSLTAADALHRLHSMALGVLAWGMLLGILVQARRPERRIAPLLGALAVVVAIATAEAVAGTFTVGGTAPFLVVFLLVAVLHPAAGAMVRLPGWDLRMLALVATAAVPWALYAVRTAQGAAGAEPDFEAGHLTFTSALALVAVLWGVIGASRHTGWRLVAGACVVAGASIGLQSLLFPDILSGLSFPWAVAALLWCAAYGAAAFTRGRPADDAEGESVGRRLALAAALLAVACSTGPEPRPSDPSAARATPPTRHEDCYNGAGFFRVDRAELQDRLPEGFEARDGSVLGDSHEGHGLLVLLYYACPEPAPFRLLMAATPVEDPAWAEDLRDVRWNWYEFARLADSEERLEAYRERGLSAALATLWHEPFHEGDTTSTFRARMEDVRVAEVRAELTDPVDFGPQSHRFWHRTEAGALVSTRLDFARHHSWLGDFRSCSLDAAMIHEAISGLDCGGVGVTEAIESLSFEQQFVAWP